MLRVVPHVLINLGRPGLLLKRKAGPFFSRLSRSGLHVLFASLEILKANRPETSMCEPGPLVLLLARPLENVASAEGALVLFRSHSHGQSFWLAVEIRDFLLLELGVSLFRNSGWLAANFGVSSSNSTETWLSSSSDFSSSSSEPFFCLLDPPFFAVLAALL